MESSFESPTAPCVSWLPKRPPTRKSRRSLASFECGSHAYSCAGACCARSPTLTSMNRRRHLCTRSMPRPSVNGSPWDDAPEHPSFASERPRQSPPLGRIVGDKRASVASTFMRTPRSSRSSRRPSRARACQGTPRARRRLGLLTSSSLRGDWTGASAEFYRWRFCPQGTQSGHQHRVCLPVS